MSVTIATFYKFTPLPDPRAMREPLREAMRARDIKGTITLAREGINATIAGPVAGITDMLDLLSKDRCIGSIIHKKSQSFAQPFARSKVKVKRELIGLGATAEPSVCVGEYVAPEDWNALITRPGVITIDTRNHYEYRIGHFRGAVNPATRDFKEMIAFTQARLDPAQHRHIAMYCTGGIRCEKYSSYLLASGFERIYHLKGGILHYLAQVPSADQLWGGACFVFDERVAVNPDLSPAAHITMCGPCGQPLSPADRAHPHYRAGEHCPYCASANG